MTFFQETEDLSIRYCTFSSEYKRRTVFIKLCCLILAGFLTACSTSSKVHIDSKPAEKNSSLPVGKGWWYARFRIAWPEQEPQWYLGTMLAAEVIAPVLKEHRRDIDLWRFHRRALHDGGEHLFSFIFYSSAATAEKIYQDIDKSKLLARLREEEKVTWVGFDDLRKVNYPNREDTSDKNWPEIIQKTWPEFIMGASQMWLDLVCGIAENERHVQTDEVLYSQVQTILTKMWMMQGRHIWLHHLNALYAYQPLLMRY